MTMEERMYRCDRCGELKHENSFAYSPTGKRLSVCAGCSYTLPKRPPVGVNGPPQFCFAQKYAGIVYVIQCNEYYKVGCSYNPQQRLNQMSVSNPYELRIIAALKTSDTTIAERYLHWRFREYHHRQEWFKLPPDAVAWLQTIDLDAAIDADPRASRKRSWRPKYEAES